MAEKEKVVAEAEEIPKTIVRRVVKDMFTQLSTGTDITVLKESLQAFSESARIFVHYLSATANDIRKESNRQIINSEDVLKALEELEFPEFVEPLKASLEEFRQKNAERKSVSRKAREPNTKSKKNKSSMENGGEKHEDHNESNEENDDAADSE